MRHAVPHDLDLPRAIQATHRAAEAYKHRLARYDPQVNWLSDERAQVRFKARGMTMEGTIDVEPRAVIFDLRVPLLLRPFQALAVPVLEREVQLWIEKARQE